MDALTLARFRKVCGLLGSEHEGERAAAAVMATRFLKNNGKTWADVSIGSDAAAPRYMNIDMANLVGYWESMYRGERAAILEARKEIKRLKREVDRLKGMWPKGKPKVAA